LDAADPSSRRSSPVARSNDAVLAYAAGCGIADVAPFIRSLRAVHFGPVILLIDASPTLAAWLSSHRVDVETLPPVWPPWASRTLRRDVALADRLDRMGEVERVIAADASSVVFQGDPFPGLPRGLTLSRDPDPRASEGTEVAAGSPEAVSRFYRARLEGVSPPTALEPARRILTLAPPPEGLFGLFHGRVQGRGGGLSPIVHRYDRLGFVDRHVQAKWGLSPKAGRRRRAPLPAWIQSLAAVNRALSREPWQPSGATPLKTSGPMQPEHRADLADPRL
jgi:hypothetical protein